MAGVTHDDGFHEIQLNGKQLVFLFMAVTVVSVVIFLCGVLVGRGVRLSGPDIVVQAESEDVPAPPPVIVDDKGGQPVPVDPNASYPGALSAKNPPEEKAPTEPPPPKAEPVSEAPAPAAVAEKAPPPAAPAPAEAPPAPKATAAKAAPAEPEGPGVAVQVAAFRVRSEADALAQRLIGKDYQAYVVSPSAGAPPIYRVRVGKFKEQREADRVVARLKKEEKFDPWIVR